MFLLSPAPVFPPPSPSFPLFTLLIVSSSSTQLLSRSQSIPFLSPIHSFPFPNPLLLLLLLLFFSILVLDCVFKILPMQRYSAQEQLNKATTNPKSMPEVVILQKLRVCMCMCTSMCVHVHVYMYLCMCACVHVCVHVYMFLCMCVHVYSTHVVPFVP